MIISPKMHKPIAFSARKTAPTFLDAEKRGQAILCPITPKDFETKKLSTGTPIFQLKPSKLSEFIRRFEDNKGIVGLAGFHHPNFFRTPRATRAAAVGVSLQLKEHPRFQDAVKLSPDDASLRLRVISEKSRTPQEVPHVVETHLDRGPQDGGFMGKGPDYEPYAVGILDTVETGPGKRGSLHRIYGSEQQYFEHALWMSLHNGSDLDIYTRSPQAYEVEQLGHALPVHNGCFVVASNIHTPSLDRWGHYLLATPTYQRIIKAKQPGMRLSPKEKEQLATALHSENGWRTPYTLVQFTRPNATNMAARSSTYEQLRDAITLSSKK